jgi:hypothetical protein
MTVRLAGATTLPDGSRARGRDPRDPLPEPGLYLASARLRRLRAEALSWPYAWLAVGVAGVSRTGTVIACLAVRAGAAPADAVGWTRAHHHRRAVETPWQRD